jgi:coenzyme Q-binding protein COQ10
MGSHAEMHALAHPCEALFDLVADIERYPEFVPGYVSARIRSRQGMRLVVDQQLGLAGFQRGFTSVATLERPHRITIRSSQAPFRHLDIDWRFRGRNRGCEVSIRISYEFSVPVLGTLARSWLEQMPSRILRAFEARAKRMRFSTPPQGGESRFDAGCDDNEPLP